VVHGNAAYSPVERTFREGVFVLPVSLPVLVDTEWMLMEPSSL
jgi:hypothetical protein